MVLDGVGRCLPKNTPAFCNDSSPPLKVINVEVVAHHVLQRSPDSHREINPQGCKWRSKSEAARKGPGEGRLLVLSFFGDEVRRTTASQGILRNDMVAALAGAILVPHASKNGKTWTTVRRALGYGQKVFTFEDEANTDLIASGARACRSNHLDNLVDEIRRIK